jgi:hypothetical protein
VSAAVGIPLTAAILVMDISGRQSMTLLVAAVVVTATSSPG